MDDNEADRKSSRDAFMRLRLEFIRLHEPRSLSGETQLIPGVGAIDSSSLRDCPRDVARPKSTRATTPTKGELTNPTTSLIEIVPAKLAEQRSLFNDLDLEIAASDGERVSFVCSRQDATSVEIVPLDRLNAHLFRATVGLEDGIYLSTFQVDGCARPEKKEAQQLYVRSDYVFAPLTLARQRRQLTVTNRGEAAEQIELKPNVPWIVVEPSQLNLSRGESMNTAIRFDFWAMKPGLNEGAVELFAFREKPTPAVATTKVAVTLVVGGAVPEVTFAPLDLGHIRQGIDPVELQIRVRARGTGPLTGMINSPESGELVDFRLNADDPSQSQFVHTFQIDSSFLSKPPPHQSEAKLKFVVVTDSFLANRRLCRVELPYRLVYLRKSLPALSFGGIRSGGTKALRLDVTCSDDREVDLAVKLPPQSDSYLEAYKARANAYVFRFSAGGLPKGATVNETIQLIDQKSGLRDHIKVLATVVGQEPQPSGAAAQSTS
jgi:hypothetical protein